MENLFTQLKNRQIFKVATIYVVAAWPLVQIADIAVPALGLPESAVPLLFKVFLVGFPISLVFAWLTNFTPDGLVKTDASREHDPDGKSSKSGNGSSSELSRSKINLRAVATVGGALLVAFGLTIGSQLIFNNPKTSNIPLTSTPELLGMQAGEKRESIAVLPFEVFSQDVEDEYFVDGMVEELLNLLAKIPELSVAARTSSFAYKGVKDKTIAQIGEELGVDTILEGSIRKNDVENRIRVSAQLFQVSSGAQLFSESFDREYRDIFQIQDEIANLVTDKMRTTLLGNSKHVDFVVGTKNVDAMVAYGKGQKELAHRTSTSIGKALSHFQAAADLDQGYARAQVGIADANILLALYGTASRDTAFESAQNALDRAFVLDPELAAAHASQGLLFSEKLEQGKAETSFKRAIELNPSYSMAYMWYGSLKQSSGDVAGAQELFIKASELDPKSPVAAFNVAWGHYLLGSESKAMVWFSKIVANDPYYPGAYLLVGHILRGSGRLDESLEMYQRALAVDAKNKQAVSSLIIAAMDLGDDERTQQWFSYLDENPSIVSANERYQLLSRYYISVKQPEQAVAVLQRLEYTDAEGFVQSIVDGEIAYYLSNYHLAVEKFEELAEENFGGKASFFQLNEGLVAAHLAFAYLKSGQTEKAKVLLTDFESALNKSATQKTHTANHYYNLAMVYAMQGDQNKAINHLQAAIDSGWVTVWQAEIEPIFFEFAEEPRFQQMLGGVNARLTYMRNRMNEPDADALAEG